MKKISFTCIGHNEVDHLKELLPQLLKLGYEVIYVDCESSDQSFEWAQSIGCKVFRRQNNMNLNVNKSFAMEQATGDWIFYVDPDERFDQSLMDEIQSKIQSTKAVAFKLPRKNHFFGQWLKYGGQYPDYQLRVFARGKASFPNQHVHESLKVDGEIATLINSMNHYPYLSISQFLKKMDFYSSFEAQHLFKKGVKTSPGNAVKYLFLKPKSRILRRYIFKRGFMDGIPGLFAAVFDGIGWMLRYFKLWELEKKINNEKRSEY